MKNLEGAIKTIQSIMKVTDERKKDIQSFNKTLGELGKIVVENYKKTFSISEQTLKAIEATYQPIIKLKQTIKDMFDTINFNNIFKGIVFEKNIDEIDQSIQEQIVKDSAVVVERVGSQETLTVNEKKSWLRRFFSFLNKIISSGLFALILTLIAPVYQDFYNDNIRPSVYYTQFEMAKKENDSMDLRIITRDIPLYRGKKMKSVQAYLSQFEIVEVIEIDREKMKIKVYNSDEIGWIYKKYTKR